MLMSVGVLVLNLQVTYVSVSLCLCMCVTRDADTERDTRDVLFFLSLTSKPCFLLSFVSVRHFASRDDKVVWLQCEMNEQNIDFHVFKEKEKKRNHCVSSLVFLLSHDDLFPRDQNIYSEPERLKLI